jgi:ferredoxin
VTITTDLGIDTAIGLPGGTPVAIHGRHLTNITLTIWRQSGPNTSGRFESYTIDSISDEASFLEMLDVLNEKLIDEGKEAVVFDHDCREGICGTCSLMIDGQAHGPQRGTATCQLHMRKFESNATIVIEPWRATAFPIIKDLMVDRAAFDRIIESGGYITAQTGGAPDANLFPIAKRMSERRGEPVHWRQDQPPQPPAPGPSRALQPHRGNGRDDGGVLRFVHQSR